MEITQARIQDMFEYKDGKLYWKNVIPNRYVKNGDRAGTHEKNGYRRIGIKGKMYLEHRLIYLYHHGYNPEFIDHIDGIKNNNDIKNLRSATRSENGGNQKSVENSKSEFKGVYWHKYNKNWNAQIKFRYKSTHLGVFTNEKDAARAYNCVAINLFGKYARINGIDEQTDKFFKDNITKI